MVRTARAGWLGRYMLVVRTVCAGWSGQYRKWKLELCTWYDSS